MAAQAVAARLPGAVLLALLTVAVIGVVLFAHWPGLAAQAVSIDDEYYLTGNPLVQNPGWVSAKRFLTEVLQPSTVPGYYQPLTMISLMLDYASADRPGNLRPFHETSLLLHTANTILVIVLLYMLFGQPWVAAIAGLLFGVHPITVETIPWIGERKTLLATFFALWCLIAYLRYARRPGWKLYTTCILLYVLALLAKPTVTPLPLMMLVMDFWPLNRLSKRAVLEKLPFLAIAVLFSVITIISQGRTGGLKSPEENPVASIPLVLCHNIIFYLHKIAWPANMSSYYPFPQPFDLSSPAVLAGAVGTCVLIPALLISLRWTRAFLAGWLFFFVAIFPTLGVLGFTPSIAYDKYAYLPVLGLLMVLAWLLGKAWSGGTDRTRKTRQAAILLVVAVATGVLTTGTRRYLVHWKTTATLFDYMLTLAPDSYWLHAVRATDCSDEGDFERAILHFGKAIEIKPDYVPSYVNRASAYARNNRYDMVIRDCSKAIELDPNCVAAYMNRAAAYAMLGQYDKSWEDVRMCRQLGATPDPKLVRNLSQITGRSE
ncbi:MAG TPA: hypothetical protein VLM89_03830 [Phycisphaerae bacterium]|nr:hypothetical protein [Phycisphaerae bacterium]